MAAVKTVDRAIDLLDCFTPDRPEYTVSELSASLSIHKSIASRLAATLRARNFLHLDPVTRRYRIGMRIFELGQLFSPSSSLTEAAAPHLRALVRKVGHASHVGVLDGKDVLIVSCVESEQQLQVAVHTGGRRPVHATAAGKLFLAFGSQDLFDQLCAGGKFPRIAPRTIESPARMKAEIESIRRSGIARNNEESARGVGAVAAPILDSGGDIIASLTTIFPLSLVDDGDWRTLEKEVRDTAARITRDLLAGSRIADNDKE